MMLAWVTDPHLNFVSADVALALCDEIAQTGASALLLSGDIAEGNDITRWLDFFGEALCLPVYFVLGNHDYYHGTIPSVRAAVSACSANSAHLHWLGEGGVVWLDPTTALVGHGGWGDGQLGQWLESPVRLNDHRLIADLTGLSRPVLHQRIRELGLQAAAHLQGQLTQAVQSATRVIVLTHVPPFSGACWHEGAISDRDWLGDFTCAATGQVLARVAHQHPDIEFRAFCGHTHSAGVYQRSDNLTVTTGAAMYGRPGVVTVMV